MVITNLDNQYKNFKKIAKSYLNSEQWTVVENAYNFANNAHGNQKRLTGDKFITHPLETAKYLAELHLDCNTLAAGLLHDVIEDCDVSLADLVDLFGEEISSLVQGVTKLTEVEMYLK